MKKDTKAITTLSLEELAAVTGGNLVWHPGQGMPSGYRRNPPPRRPQGNHSR